MQRPREHNRQRAGRLTVESFAMPPTSSPATTPSAGSPAKNPLAGKMRRFVLRLVVRLAITLAVLWYALHLVGAPTDGFSSAFRHQLQWALLFLAGCGAALILVGFVRFIVARQQQD